MVKVRHMISKIEQYSKKGYIDEEKQDLDNEVLAVMKLTKIANRSKLQKNC